MEEKKLIPDSHYEERRITPKRRQGVLPSAGIWLLDGRYRVAEYGSEAEARLRERDALLVANLVFDGSHAERPVRGDVSLTPYPAPALPELGKQRAVEALGWAPASN